MKKEVLRLLDKNARISAKDIADRLDSDEKTVNEIIIGLEKDGVIKGYKVIVDENTVSGDIVKALIEVRVRPERDGGFNRVAERISKFPEVVSLYLVSGGYDLQLEVKGDTLQEVAEFVSSKLATIDGVISTATHFLLKKYKESGLILHDGEEYERLKVTP
jgi:DNA-binding Lrp family transcriptional regulator